ncbi:hypothetical protein F4778DRAFT_737273 [Xylariomycetidae sp. FL2044]|nr:hypothetical protein F4778DRAFT_737273 [Xylariomycetidae sp. FL2044]
MSQAPVDLAMPSEPGPPKSEESKPGEDDISKLRESFLNASKQLIFACGGSIAIGSAPPTSSSPPQPEADAPVPDSSTMPASQSRRPSEASTTSSGAVPVATSRPVTLRWDAKEASTASSLCKLTFANGGDGMANLEQLLQDMQPAGFGLRGRDVYDESYRRALQLDKERFACSLNPYELGIVDEVAQVLLPDFASGSGNDSPGESKRSVRAELYKLNVYTGPSGHFRPHRDTPRSPSHFGSLVLCLPLAHEGGQLVVRHQGQDQTFDWSKLQAEPGIHWAAFYGDCEHEVLPVHSGHRVTLTYNLYAVRGSGLLAGHCRAMDPKQLPLYKSLGSLLTREDFMPEGGHLGIWTTHAYAHANKHACLPDALKGLDMAVWEALRSLGCEVNTRAVVDDPESYGNYKAIGTLSDFKCVNELIVDRAQLHHEILSKWRVVEDGEKVKERNVIWLNGRPRGQKQLQFGYMAYGNDASLAVVYSDCAIIGKVPPFAERQKVVG